MQSSSRNGASARRIPKVLDSMGEMIGGSGDLRPSRNGRVLTREDGSSPEGISFAQSWRFGADPHEEGRDRGIVVPRTLQSPEAPEGVWRRWV